ncbi:putative death-receptor fusion protein-domain-containing protein [Trichophaea hybrida]|nr:putative death-receptor fusion protein-domain-containing protein [Trichophaea hybrida]
MWGRAIRGQIGVQEGQQNTHRARIHTAWADKAEEPPRLIGRMELGDGDKLQMYGETLDVEAVASTLNEVRAETVREKAHFDDATPGLTKALKDLLTNTLSLAAMLEASQGVVRSLAMRGLAGVSVGEGRKGGYYVLDVAVRKGAGVGWTFEHAGGAEKLVGEMLANLVDRNLGPAIGKAVVTLLAARRKELMDEGVEEKEWFMLWEDPLKKALRSEELRPRVVNYVLPGMLKPSAECFRMFVQSLGLGEDGNIRSDEDLDLGALLCCLKAGKELDFVGEIGDKNKVFKTSKAPVVRIHSDLVTPLLGHAFSHIRVSAFNLVVQSASITRPFTPGTLSLLKAALPPLHAESDAEVRDLIIGGIRNLIERIACSSYTSEKELKNLQQKLRSGNRPTPDDIRKMVQLDSRVSDAKDFCEWYIGLLETLLRPGSNYQRCITGLRALGFLIRSGVDASLTDRMFTTLPGKGSIASNGKPFKKGLFKWPEFSKEMDIFRPGIKRALLEAMFNPFEDVRAISAEVLQFDPKWDAGNVKSFLERGLQAMNDNGRARDSDGFARTVALIFELSKRGDIAFAENGEMWGFKIDGDLSGLGVVRWILDVLEKEYIGVAVADFQRAVRERPIHGLFTSLLLILETYGSSEEEALAWEVHERIFKSCEEIWRLTKAPLCFDSPEGHVPVNFDEEDEDMTTQTVMSYSWRAVKESSSLLGAILGKASISSLFPTDFERGGKLLLQQLADIRHRGAFSSVSPSFVALCTRCFKSSDPALQELPRTWLRRNLDLIMEKSNAITRRSAGLPYLIMGVLASETDPARPLLSTTFARFVEIATMPASTSQNGEKMDLPQVHALNCLKFLFTDARVSQIVVPFMGKGLELAVSCFGSEIWAIRNCGVMLFTALTNRLFGLRKSRNDYTSGITTRSFFEKFVGVRTVLLKNLQEKVGALEGGDAVSVEMVYPVLSLIARMEVDPEYDGMEEFREPIKQCMRSRIWKVREMAARAFTALVGPKQVVDTISGLMKAGIEKQNVLHGNLCAVRALLERRVRQTVQDELEVGEVWRHIAEVFEGRFGGLVETNVCAVTKAVMLQLLTSHTENLNTNLGLRSCFERYLNHNRTEELATSSTVGRSLLKEHLVAFTLTFQPSKAPDLLKDADEEILLYTINHILSLPKSPLLPTKIIWEIATLHPWNLLRATALTLLRRSPPLSPSEEDFKTILALLQSPPTESIKEAALALLGPIVSALPVESRPNALQILLGELIKAADGDEPYTTRTAALSSLSSLALPLKLKTGADEALIRAYSLVYDLLNDDDDDIRLSAASLAQQILGSEILLLPLTTAEKLTLSLPRYFPVSTVLLQTAISRITGDVTAVESWQKATKKDKILFQREKQNLWVDAVGVVEVWGVVAELVLARGVGKKEIEGLREWVGEGRRLVAERETVDGSVEVTGGWGREEEVVAFLARVRVAAKVVGIV